MTSAPVELRVRLRVQIYVVCGGVIGCVVGRIVGSGIPSFRKVSVSATPYEVPEQRSSTAH